MGGIASPSTVDIRTRTRKELREAYEDLTDLLFSRLNDLEKDHTVLLDGIRICRQINAPNAPISAHHSAFCKGFRLINATSSVHAFFFALVAEMAK